mmetsp:Transcript_11705/g.35666  ORF Transcript_11705/g.35666 Transcript_11705/m.35666 type:complete len:176 (+) Transcript_11705:132-659(+)|eukprot:CAMPEP_0198734852 /NCGR_PEP_ID=MMETSP1475-20131203/55592_1 /TAXON_ID= ORGANISM="Unidentified sp., Strain CCMP1999" /NCGR_SAMPLE_ID=MMETSP1475 /ASSEMBLY_ACC=CAM_ASM_001111 /LENGTH=175 /DNA_ID=CAMNT_0044498403 /DNA_START=114 /DNA_END=641 /DNA_ORIENTATION=-
MEEEGLSSVSSGSETAGRKPTVSEGKRKRKKYVLTKRREYWTEQEHAKFERALSMYGREWKLIEQEVGTKTAVQIRSHAQKYFLRLERMKSSDRPSPVSSFGSSPASSPTASPMRVEPEVIEDIAHTLLSMKNAVPASRPMLPSLSQHPRCTVCSECTVEPVQTNYYPQRAAVFF